MRLGHEWAGMVAAVGDGVDPGWLGRRVMGDTMLGDGAAAAAGAGTSTCARSGRRSASAAAAPARWPSRSPCRPRRCTRCPTPSTRCWARWSSRAATPCARRGPPSCAGDRALVLGPGTIGLLTAMFARAAGAEVHLLGRSRALAGLRPRPRLRAAPGPSDTLPDLPFDAVVDASNAAACRPGPSTWSSRPAGSSTSAWRARPSRIDTRTLALKDVTAVGILSASPGLAATIEAYASGAVDPRPLVAATVGLDQVAAVLAGERPAAPARPQDPRRPPHRMTEHSQD